jgi:hypothetical protein
LLQPDQHLGDNNLGETPKADLPAPTDRCFGQPPTLLVEVPVLAAGAATPELMGLAVEAVVMAALLHTRDNPTRCAGVERLGRRVPTKLGRIKADRGGLIDMCPAKSPLR